MKKQAVDTRAVCTLMEEYYNSVYNADAESLKEMFHEKAVMIGFFGHMFLSGTPEPFFRGLTTQPSSACIGTECCTIYSSLDIQENTAEARTYAYGFYGDSTVEDHFEMVKEDGSWKIICKIVNTLD